MLNCCRQIVMGVSWGVLVVFFKLSEWYLFCLSNFIVIVLMNCVNLLCNSGLLEMTLLFDFFLVRSLSCVRRCWLFELYCWSFSDWGTTEGPVVFEFSTCQLLGLLRLNSHLELIVNEGDYHAVKEGDQVWGLVVLHLLVALHENESSIWW